VGTAALPKTGRDLTRWGHAGMLLLLLTGLAMFFADASRYLHNPAFRIKMALVLTALAWHFTLRRRGRFGAITGVLLWTAVAIAGRAIADFDISLQAGARAVATFRATAKMSRRISTRQAGLPAPR
jgi:hypothetical protein